MSADRPPPSPSVPAIPDCDLGVEAVDAADPSTSSAALDAALEGALSASACLGAFVHELPADRVGLAPRLREAFGLAPDARAGLPLARVLARLHVEDRPHVEAMLAAARETRGPFEAEFRMPAVRGGRFLRLTGRAEFDAAGRTLRTRGLAFDLTEMRLGRGGSALQAQWQINQFAGHVIAMKGLVTALGSPSLARLLDRIAVETGFELARRLGEAPGGARH